MSFIDKTLGAFGLQRKSLAAPEDFLTELFGAQPSAAGISVTPANAMRATPVRRAVQAIAEPVGALPLHVYKRDGDKRERDKDHAVAKVLRDPNEWTSGQELREQLQRDCLLHGNGYAEIVRVDNTPRELIRLDPATIQIDTDDYGAPIYKQLGESARIIPRENVFHLKAPSLNGVKGVSPILDAKEAIGLALLLETHGSRLFKNGAKPGGVIEIGTDIGDDAIKKIRAAWQASHGGENAGRTGVLIDGAQFKSVSMSSVDSQYLELRRFAIDEIARVFGVPPSMIYEMGRATWSNTEQMSAQFLTFTLLPWLKRWSSEIRLKLFNENERDGWFAEFLTDDLLTVDFAARATAYGQYRSMGVMTSNEVRKGLNLPPRSDGEALDNPYTTTNKTPEAAANG
jgi:HK97 family phage portal protein